MRNLLAGLVAFALATSAQTVYATDCSSGLSTCIQSDTLWPHAGAARFVGVGGTETLREGGLGFGLVTTYLSRPIVLGVASPSPSGTEHYVIDNQVNGTFLFAYGVTKRLELDLALPVTFGQSGAGKQPVTGGNQLRDTASRDMRFGFAYALVSHQAVGKGTSPHDWSLTPRFEVSAPIGDRDNFAGESSAVFVPTLAAEYRLGRFFTGLEAGARLRRTATFAGARIGSQGMAGLGIGYDVLGNQLLTVGGEARMLPILVEQADAVQGSRGLTTRLNGKAAIPAEWMLSVGSAPFLDGDLGFIAAGGGAIPLGDQSAMTVPRFRFALSIRYAPRAHPSREK